MAKTPSRQTTPLCLNLPFEIDPTRDRYEIKGGAGVAVVRVTRPTGEIINAHSRADGALQQMSVFDPSALSVQERRQLEKKLYNDNYTQAEIADLVGVKQQTVAHDLKVLRQQAAATIDHDLK